MVENDLYFKENVKISFKKVKEHNLTIENSLKELKLTLNSKISDLNIINSNLKDIKALIIKNKEEINEFKFSTGNKGVLNNDKQQPTTHNLHKVKHEFIDEFSEKFNLFPQNYRDNQSSLFKDEDKSLTSEITVTSNEENLQKQTLTSLENNNQQPTTYVKKPIETLTSEENDLTTSKNEDISQTNHENTIDRTLTSNFFDQNTQINPSFNPKPSENAAQTLTSVILGLKEEITKTLTSLTDREISLLLAIHDLNSENLDTSYSHLAQKLKLSENTIRVIVMSLLNKNAPIVKERYFNRKVSLSLKKEFQDLKLLHQLLALRNSTKDQRTLFEL